MNPRLSDGHYLVAGKDVSAFTDSEERAVELDRVVPFPLARTLSERGARHQAAADFEPKLAVSGRLVTGQNPASASAVGEAMLALLDPP